MSTVIYISKSGSTISAPSFTKLDSYECTFVNNDSVEDVLITEFSPSFWFDNNNLGIAPDGNLDSKLVKDVPVNTQTTVKLRMGAATKFITIESHSVAKPPPDHLPDPFGLVDIVDLQPKSARFVEFNITGINEPVTATITGAVFKYDGLPFSQTSRTVENDKKIVIVAQAPTDFNLSNTITMTVGTRTETFNISTAEFPTVDNLVTLDKSLGQQIGLKEISVFFGGPIPTSLKDYYRGGTYVPNIRQNSPTIPVAGSIKLTDFFQASTGFYFIIPPPDKIDDVDSIATTRRGYINYDITTDFTMGFGDYVKNNSLFKYSFTRTDSQPSGDIVATVNAGQSMGTFSAQNTSIQIGTARTYDNEEVSFRGTVTIYAKHPQDGTIIQRTAQWAIFVFGP